MVDNYSINRLLEKPAGESNTSSENSYLDYSAKLQQIPGDKEHGLFAGSAFFSYGIELSVTPRISPDGLISVEITPSI